MKSVFEKEPLQLKKTRLRVRKRLLRKGKTLSFICSEGICGWGVVDIRFSLQEGKFKIECPNDPAWFANRFVNCRDLSFFKRLLTRHKSWMYM